MAKDILLIFELRESINQFFPFPLIDPPVIGRPIREQLNERIDKIESAAIPLALVFIASSLECYLKGVSGKEKVSFYHLIEDYRNQVGSELTAAAHELRIKRNVILHKGGVIDEQAKVEFTRIGFKIYTEEQKLDLKVEEMRGHINSVGKICRLVS